MWSDRGIDDFSTFGRAEKVSVFKGFRLFSKSLRRAWWLSPERNALPTALRLDLAFFVSGQTCGQPTHFGIFLLSCTDEIVRFFKAFSDLQNLQISNRWFAPERNALPTALRLDLCCVFSTITRSFYHRSCHRKRIYYTKCLFKSQSFLIALERFSAKFIFPLLQRRNCLFSAMYTFTAQLVDGGFLALFNGVFPARMAHRHVRVVAT